MAIEVQCPNCKRVWHVSMSASGSRSTCRRCHTRVRVRKHVLQRKRYRGLFGHEIIELKARRKSCLDVLLSTSFLGVLFLLIVAAILLRH